MKKVKEGGKRCTVVFIGFLFLFGHSFVQL